MYWDIKTRDDFDIEKEKLLQIIKAGREAEAKLSILEHKFNWVRITEDGVQTAFGKDTTP